MTKINAVKKIVVEDFSAADHDMIMKLAQVLNPFLDQVNAALNQKLSIDDNFRSKIYKFSLAAGVSTLVVAWPHNEKPTSVVIGNLSLSTGAAPAAVFSLSSYHSDAKITLTFIGLNASYAHNVTVVATV